MTHAATDRRHLRAPNHECKQERSRVDDRLEGQGDDLRRACFCAGESGRDADNERRHV